MGTALPTPPAWLCWVSGACPLQGHHSLADILPPAKPQKLTAVLTPIQGQLVPCSYGTAMLLELLLPPALTLRCDPHRPTAQQQAASGSSLAGNTEIAESLAAVAAQGFHQGRRPGISPPLLLQDPEHVCARAAGEDPGTAHGLYLQLEADWCLEKFPGRVSPAVNWGKVLKSSRVGQGE